MTDSEELALDKMALFEDGTPMLVARPENPDAVMEIIKGSVGSKDWDKVTDQVNEVGGTYTFVGYLERTPVFKGVLAKARARQHEPCIVDAQGNVIGKPEPGDSFVKKDFWDEAPS
jgi:hypothetical protein